MPPKKGYKQSPEHIANNRAAKLKYYQEHPDAAKEWNSTPEARANNSAGVKKYHREHPDTVKKYFEEHPNAAKERQNSPEELQLIQQYDSPLINKLRSKYWDLNSRCNDPDSQSYKDYGGRGIENKFASRLDFLNYVINELHITQFSQIEGLEIDRIDNDGNYEPENIRFVTRKENCNNCRNRRNSK